MPQFVFTSVNDFLHIVDLAFWLILGIPNSNGVLPGPFDESHIISLLFPLPTNNYAEVTQLGNTDHVVFANVLEWYQPSMAIFVESETYPLKWLARIEHHNPFSDYDFTVVALLA